MIDKVRVCVRSAGWIKASVSMLNPSGKAARDLDINNRTGLQGT